MEPSHAKIYFAGPLFTAAERDWNRAVAEGLRNAGFDVLLPQETAEQTVKAGQPIPTRALFQSAIDSVERCDAVLAILDGPDADSGTCFECGYAFSRQKPIVCVRTDLRAGGDGGRGVNLMLSESAACFAATPLGLRPSLAETVELVAAALRSALER